MSGTVEVEWRFNDRKQLTKLLDHINKSDKFCLPASCIIRSDDPRNELGAEE